jgi:hypothetical protein
MNIVFARYNRHRLPPFQVETSIVASNGSRVVVKKALTPEAAAHIQAIRAGYDLLQRCLIDGNKVGRGVSAEPSDDLSAISPRQMEPRHLILPRLENCDASSIMFQYVEGQSLDQLLFLAFRARDRKAFFEIIDGYCALLKKAFKPAVDPRLEPKTQAVFGIKSAADAGNAPECLPVGVIDAMFENIIVSGNAHFLIDIEWVFEGALPLAFVVYRSLFYFHKVKYFEFGIEKWISFAELLQHAGIGPEQAQRYREMDESFQAYVYGPARCYKFKEQYKKRAIAVHALEQTIDHQRNVLRKYHNEIVGMRAVLAEKDRIINEIINSFGWRAWLKIARGINCLCPPGSLRRRLADRLLAPLKARSK